MYWGLTNINASQSGEVVGEVADLMASNKKSAIHVLHVDDDPSLLEISKKLLMDIDGSFAIDHACCVDEAFKKLSTGNYDVVISDYEMPQKSGLQFLEELRKQKNKTPFILFTGKSREEVAIKALNLGADGYYDKQGSPETVYGELAHGIKQAAERANAKTVLEESEKRYRSIIEQAVDSIIVHDKNRRIIDVNEATSRKLGYTKEELLSMSITDISPTATENAIEDLWSKVLAGQVITLEAQYKHKNGNIIPVEVTLGPLVVAKEIHMIGLVRDITERKKTEEEMRKSKLILQNSSDAIITTDLQGKIISWNKGATDIFGYSAEEILGENIAKIVKPIERERIAPTQLKTMQEEQVLAGEWEGVRKDGSSVWLLLTTTLLKNDKNEPVGMISFGKDITKHKQIADTWQKSEERFRQLTDNAEEWIWEVDSSGLYTYSSIIVEKLLGYKPEEIVGKKHFYDLFPADEREKLKNAAFQAFATKNSFNGFLNRNVHKKGSFVWLSTSGVPILDEKGDLLGYRGIDIDITERKKNEDALRQERGMLESVTKNIGAGLVMISKDYKILWMNNFLRQLTGASENDHCYSSFNTCTTICPDCGPKKIFAGAAFDSREYCNQTEFNKDHPVWFELVATPIKDAEGNVVAALELTVNITEKKEAEKKQNESNDRIKMMNEKLLVLGSLTRHDVGNKMMAAKSNLYLLRKRIGDNTDLAKYLDSIDSALVSSDRIFEFSRLYEKIGVEKPSKENVFESFNKAATRIPNLTNVEILNECKGLEVVADSLLKQLFYNFIDNSLKHGQKVTQIRLHYIKEDDEVKLCYEDNGVGVPKANKSRLFEAGFSTGKSTGLGLYLVKKMMEVYGWTIAEEGEEGKGARFVMTFQKPKE